MSKFAPRRAGVRAWVVLAAIFIGLGWAAIRAFLYSPGFLALVIVVFSGLFAMARHEVNRDRVRLNRLVLARDGQSICEFARDLDYRSVDTWVIRAVYEELQRQLTYVHPKFPIRADDSLKADLLLDDDDLELDVVRRIQARAGRALEYTSANPYFGKVKTVRDLVLFFECQPRLGGSVAALN